MSNEKGPWDHEPTQPSKGRRRKTTLSDQDLMDPDQMLRNLWDQIRGPFSSRPPQEGQKRKMGLILLVILALWAASGLFRVQPNQQAVVLRFGKAVRVAQPGLNIHIPFPFETAIVRDVTTVNRTDNEISKTGYNASYQDGLLMLTGDENIVVVRFTVLWTIKNLSDYLFNARSVEETIRASASSVVREIIAQMPISSVLTKGRTAINLHARTHLQELVDHYGLGVHINEVVTGRIDPPKTVIEAYRDVQKARADAERLKNNATAHANRIMPEARGKAQSLIQQAEGEKQTMIALAKGETAQFNVLVPFLKANFDITSALMHLKVIPPILQKTQKVVLGGDGKERSLVQFLRTQKDLTSSKQETAAPFLVPEPSTQQQATQEAN